MALKDIALSSGSACTSASLEPSYVLRAIGADEDLAHSSIRFGLGRFTTEAEVKYTADKCVEHVKRLREMRYFMTRLISVLVCYFENAVHSVIWQSYGYYVWWKRVSCFDHHNEESLSS